MKLRQTNIIIVILGLLVNPVFSQQVKVEAKLDTNVLLVGDQTRFKLGLTIPENYNFYWPVFGDTLVDNVEIVNKGSIDTLMVENGLMTLVQDLTITSFDSGYYVLPPITFSYGSAGNSPTDQIETEPYLLNVFTVPVDTAQSIKPIKGPMLAPYTFAEIYPWVLLALGVLLIAGFAIYFLVKKEKHIPFIAPRPKPKLPPHRIALDALGKLKGDKIWQQGHVKEYYSRLTDIIRIYIENSSDVRAVEMTTPEILDSIKKTDFSSTDVELLGEMLELADLVKFAKFKTQPSENEQSMDWAYDFVKHTMNIKEDVKEGKLENQDKPESKLVEVEN